MNHERKIRLGCVADDFTGASDAASFLAETGVDTVLYNGISALAETGAADMGVPDAAIVALKCRTQHTQDAVREVIQAFRLLKQQGAERIFYKYCSTFDSTEDGNIGPVLDALLEVFEIPFTILCPSLPVNQRVVKHGTLYVNGKPLAETHMRNHPLTPMRQSRVKTLMEMQSRYPVFEMGCEQLYGEQDTFDNYIRELMKQQKHFYIVPDYYKQEHGEQIIRMFGELPLLSGGSGLMGAIGNQLIATQKRNQVPERGKAAGDGETQSGAAILLAGSCSEMTLKQISYFIEHGGVACQLDPSALSVGMQSILDIQRFLMENRLTPVLIYSSMRPDEVAHIKRSCGDGIAELLEKTLADVATYALEHGWTRCVVAGGETSGAITKRLDFSSYQIGRSVAPGVPVMTPLQDERIRLVLKSGNFGEEDFFWQAVNEIC